MKKLTEIEEEALYQLFQRNFQFGLKLLKMSNNIVSWDEPQNEKRFIYNEPFLNAEIICFRETKRKFILFQNNGRIDYEKDGTRHRIDGPATIHSNGKESYWLEGKPITKEDFYARKTNNRRHS